MYCTHLHTHDDKYQTIEEYSYGVGGFEATFYPYRTDIMNILHFLQ